VDVVTGGASAVYGSDAIAGVVNFIMKKNFEGLQLDGQLGGNWHNNSNGFAQQRVAARGYDVVSGNIWDGKTVNLNLTAGANILDGRGNVTGYFGYSSMDPVRSSARDFGGCQLNYTDDLDDLACGGSSNSNYFLPNNETTNPDGDVFSVLGSQFVPRGSATTTPPAVFNSQRYIYMQRQDKRYNAGFLAHVDLNDRVKPYAEFSFMNDRTHQEVAPTALFRGSNVLTNDGNYLINCSNPLLSAQQAALMCTPAEIAADLAVPGSASANVEIGRRNIEGGGRTYEYEHTNYRIVAGTKGDIADGWTYDVYGQHYYTTFQNVNGKDFTFDKIASALQVTGTASAPVCISGGACVAYNIFSDGGVTQDAIHYLETPGTASGSTTLRTVHFDTTGDLGRYGLKLPTTDEGVAVNFGYEYRKESVLYAPDAATVSGLIVGAGGASPAIDNSISVKEFNGEVRIPIAHGIPGIHDLVADAGYRYSDYSTAGGVDTFKFGLQYSPVEDVRFRSSFNRAIRAPSIVELFNPQLVGKISFGEDPCAPSESDGTLAATFEQCARTGVTQAQYDNASIPQGTANQLTQLQGGNPDLKPEKADTLTVGVTVRPEALPGFNGSLDYYHIKLDGTVGALPANLILSNCLNTGDPTFCSQLVRNPVNGTLNGASVASGGYIVQTNVNIGAGTLDGIDLQATYKFDLGTLGALRLMLNGAYLLASKTTPIPGGGSYDCAGLFGSTCQTVNPKWRHNLRASWAFMNDVTVNAIWRYSGSSKLDNNDSDPDLFQSVLGATAIFRAKLPAVSYIDLSGSWDVSSHIQVRGGINNLFDKDPPISPSDIISGGAPNYYEFYDSLGRQAFVAVTAKF
jgi:outer membrane receptor protein involved in Fe transport